MVSVSDVRLRDYLVKEFPDVGQYVGHVTQSSRARMRNRKN
jgi:hypothetical protein